MIFTRKLFAILILALITFSCSQEMGTPETKEQLEEGSRLVGVIDKTWDVRIFTCEYFDTKTGYLREVDKTVNGKQIKGYYIRMKGQGDAQWTPEHVSTSEAMGYGMRLCALGIQVAGIQSEKNHLANIFDGLWNVQHAFPSYTNPNLHSWVIPSDFNPATTRGKMVSSATDGELDIAYALLAMDKIYGQTRGINYKAEAKKIILALSSSNMIRTENVNGRDYTYIVTGDWTKWGEGKYVARCSDFMPHHFKTFIRFMEAEGLTGYSEYGRWKKLLNTVKYFYANNPVSDVGMFPDFLLIKGSTNELKPLPPDSPQAQALGEEVDTNMYDYNACRVPWRMAEDTYFTDDEVVAAAAKKLYFLLGEDHPFRVTGTRFDMNGNNINSLRSTAFEAPFAAIIEPAMNLVYKSLPTDIQRGRCMHHYWYLVNEAFDSINSRFIGYTNDNDQGYYEDSINILCQYYMLKDGHITEPYNTKGL